MEMHLLSHYLRISNRVHLSVSSRLSARSVLIVKKLNKCIRSIYFSTENAIFYIHSNISTHRYIGRLHGKEIIFFKKSDSGKNRLDTKSVYMLCYTNDVQLYNSK